MKTIILLSFITGTISTSLAQSPVDTFSLFKKPVASAWSQRTDTVKGFRQQPISSQPFPNTPVPPPTTNPIDNPTSGQTNPAQYEQPGDIPAATQWGGYNQEAQNNNTHSACTKAFIIRYRAGYKKERVNETK